MSSDNFMAIAQENGKYIGYHCSASMYYPQSKCFKCIGIKHFEVDTIEQAIYNCQEGFDPEGYLEYGYRFIDCSKPDWDEDRGYCLHCPQDPKLPLEGSWKAKKLGCTCKKFRDGSYKLIFNCPVHDSPLWKGKEGEK